MTAKLDLYKVHKAEYVTPRKPALVRAKPAQYLAIEGRGAPGNARFQACIGALYGMAFTVKMTRKFAGKQDYVVCKLEGQYFGDLPATPKEEWTWKLLIRTPDFIGQKDMEAAVATLIKRGKSPEVKEVKLETIDEGDCVQMLHVGPYDKEHETVAQMRCFAEAGGLKLAGPHHEIYLSDPRRVPPERLKTILRVPALKRAASVS
jgi:hypothetical protein